MNLQNLKTQLPDFAKDIKLNLSSVLTEEGAPDLTQKQIHFIALSSAYATKQSEIIDNISSEAEHSLSEDEIRAAKAASTIMAMNNIYYRFIHLVSDKEFSGMPAKLRMNVMANPGVDKIDFELASLAISAINGCGMCIDSHASQLNKAGASKKAIQSSVRIAAVINAAANAIVIA